VVFWRDPRLPMIEGRQAVNTHAGYRPHTHPTLSIGIVDGGQSTFRSGNRLIQLRPGSVVVTPPGQVHACNPLRDQPWSYRTFHFDAAWMRADSKQAKAKRWPEGVLRQAAAGRCVDRIERALRSPGDPTARGHEIRRCLRGLLRLCPRPARARRTSDEPLLLGIRDYLATHCLERIPIAVLGRLAGVSAFRLIRRFKREFGLTPHAFQLDQRINRTRELLKRGDALADVAYVSGFSDQSHFQRTFTPRVAVTPAQYRSPRPPTPHRPR
jgi:AraC-like DNA-binding protein